MKVLVIGGCGFIGSHVVDALMGAGHSVRVYDRQPERFRAPIKGVEYIFGDFSDRMTLAEAISGTDAVYHLVSTTFPGTADLDPPTDVTENLVGTLRLMDTMLGLNVRRLLFMSSGGAIYGIPQITPTPEDHPLRPIGSYGIVKAAIESYLEMYRRTRGLSPVVIRASNPYGPRQGHVGVQGIVGTFLRKAFQDESIEIWGDGTVVRDYLAVTDLADLCVRAGTSEQTGAYNGGSGKGVSVNEIVAHIAAVTGRKLDVTHKAARPVDVPRSILDCTRAEADFGWRAQCSIRQGIADTWDWMQRQG